MQPSDYELHIDHDRLTNLFGDENESEAFPFGEDMEAINKIIEEEIGPQKKRAGRPVRPRP